MPQGGAHAISKTSEHPLHALDERERLFAQFVSEGKSIHSAGNLAGFAHHWASGPTYKRLTNDPRILKAIEFLRKKSETMILASRQKVLEGFLDAISQAKLMSDPAVQIAGWREIGKMCGYYAPEVKEINISVGAKRVVGQLEVLSDVELLELIEKDQEALEGEATEVLNAPSAQTVES